MDTNEVRVRIAPSPTGRLHLGSARAALFNYLFAKKTNGKFILRIEDTDTERSKSEYEADIIEGLNWLGLKWDEGPLSKDPKGPYRQSERLEIYKQYIEKLISDGNAYRCFCTIEELEAQRERAQLEHKPFVYSGKCRNLSEVELAQKTQAQAPFVIRFKTAEKIIEFNDLIRGKIAVDTKTIGDFVIVKSDSTPLFLLASAIDDGLMEISHIIRGEDHISNTPKQLMLFDALGFRAPIYGHLPLVVNPDHTKLSKRKNPTSVSADFKNKGYLPDAMINFIALMGWNPKDEREYFTLAELESEWQIENVGKSPAVFDIKRLEHFNSYYIRKMQLGELAEVAKPFIMGQDSELLSHSEKNKDLYFSALALVQERIRRLDEIPSLIMFFFFPDYNLDKKTILEKKFPEQLFEIVFSEIVEQLKNQETLSREAWETYLRALAEKHSISAGALLWAIRYTLTGQTASPGAFEMLTVLPKEEVISRLQRAIDLK